MNHDWMAILANICVFDTMTYINQLRQRTPLQWATLKHTSIAYNINSNLFNLNSFFFDLFHQLRWVALHDSIMLVHGRSLSFSRVRRLHLHLYTLIGDSALWVPWAAEIFKSRQGGMADTGSRGYRLIYCTEERNKIKMPARISQWCIVSTFYVDHVQYMINIKCTDNASLT